MRHLFKYFTAASLLLSGCAPGGVGQGFSTQESGYVVKNTAPEHAPVQTQKLPNYEIIRGATKNNNLAVSYASDLRRMVLRGELELTPVGANQKSLQIPIDLAGLADEEGYVYLKAYDAKAKLVPGVRLGAKATCLGEDMNCAASFIDIYLEFEDRIYHHQLQSSPVKQPSPTTPGKTTEDKKDDKKKDDHDHDHGDTKKPDDFGIFDEEDDDADEGVESHYVGNPVQDIEKILGIKAPTPPKKNVQPPKKDPTPGPKTDPPKEEPKADNKNTMFPVTNQAVDSAQGGRLEKGIDMYEVEKSMSEPGFKILRPKQGNQFATSELAYLIVKMGELTKKELPESYISIGDLSSAKGGRLKGHKSHTNGLDADMSYYFNNKSAWGYFTPAVEGKNKINGNWMVNEQWKLFKFIVQTQMVDRIFVHNTLKKALCEMAIKSGELVKDQNSLASETLRRLSHEAGHANHFHLRIKCGKGQIRCRQMTDPAAVSGCF